MSGQEAIQTLGADRSRAVLHIAQARAERLENELIQLRQDFQNFEAQQVAVTHHLLAQIPNAASVLQYFAIYPTMLYLLHPILFYSIPFYSTPLYSDSYITSSTLFYSIPFHSIPLHLQLHFILFYSVLFLSTPQ